MSRKLKITFDEFMESAVTHLRRQHMIPPDAKILFLRNGEYDNQYTTAFDIPEIVEIDLN